MERALPNTPHPSEMCARRAASCHSIYSSIYTRICGHRHRRHTITHVINSICCTFSACHFARTRALSPCSNRNWHLHLLLAGGRRVCLVQPNRHTQKTPPHNNFPSLARAKPISSAAHPRRTHVVHTNACASHASRRRRRRLPGMLILAPNAPTGSLAGWLAKCTPIRAHPAPSATFPKPGDSAQVILHSSLAAATQ